METTILIPTHGRPTLLNRTLESIARCKLPEGFRELVVIENGSEAGAEELVSDLPTSLNARYLHRNRANKSHALNEALQTITPGLVIFFDDDVDIATNTLIAYEKAAMSHGPGEAFFGGPVRVDREVEPPAWLESLLPHSVRGYDLNSCREASWYLGFNWAAFRDDITQLGGFDPNLGPGGELGTDVGDEVELQERMRRAGLNPVDVSGAVVRHHVPTEHCTLSWTLERKYRVGISKYYREREDVSLPNTVAKGILRSGFQIIKGMITLDFESFVGGWGRLCRISGMVRCSFTKENYR